MINIFNDRTVVLVENSQNIPFKKRKDCDYHKINLLFTFTTYNNINPDG